jgi:hypothetical protein
VSGRSTYGCHFTRGIDAMGAPNRFVARGGVGRRWPWMARCRGRRSRWRRAWCRTGRQGQLGAAGVLGGFWRAVMCNLTGCDRVKESTGMVDRVVDIKTTGTDPKTDAIIEITSSGLG